MAFPVRSSTKFERVKLNVASAKKSDSAKLPNPNVRRIRLRSPIGRMRHLRCVKFDLTARVFAVDASIMSGSIVTKYQACNR
jgi:hypothetical protein